MDVPQSPDVNQSKRSWSRLWPWLIILAVLLFVGAIRVRLLNLPLERDEGEYAYAGQLILQGIPPYELAYNMKLPGTYAAYAAGMAVFGQTTTGVHLTLLVVSSLNIIFVFLLTRQIGGVLAGLVAATSYGIMAASQTVAGLAAHATHFVVLFAVPATWVLIREIRDGRRAMFFLSGLLYGLAFLMKQQGLCFGLFGFAFLVWTALQKKEIFSVSFIQRAFIFGVGLSVPFLVTCVILALSGVFGRFWFWTVDYARSYESILTLRQGIQEHLLAHLDQTRDLSIGLWVLTLLGVSVALCVKCLRPAAILSVCFWLFSFLGTSAGLYFRGHYFILLLPAFALLTGLAVVALREIMPKTILPDVMRSLPLIGFGMILVWMVYYQSQIFFQWSPSQVSSRSYGDSMFTEAVVAADQIHGNSGSNSKVAVIGSEPEIYFYAHRHSATGYIYTYALMEAQPFALKMQHEMAQEIETASPEFLVNVIDQMSWLPSPDSSRYLADWSKEYSGKYYQKIGMIGHSPDGKLLSFWGSNATNAVISGGERLDIYERLSATGGEAAAVH